MLNNPKIHPELAFVSCGMFVDPESAYLQSKKWWEENQKKAEEATRNEVQGNDKKTPGDKGTGTDATVGTEARSDTEEEN
jgi:hypothetical protein